MKGERDKICIVENKGWESEKVRERIERESGKENKGERERERKNIYLYYYRIKMKKKICIVDK